MKLLLTSSGLRNESLREALGSLLDKLAGECKCVYIPTSYHAAGGDVSWLVEEINTFHALGWEEFAMLDIAVKSAWDRGLWWPKIEEADVIVMGGGNAPYLSYWLQRSGLFEALPELLKNKVYVGVSAGSMMLTAGIVSSVIGQTDNPEDWGGLGGRRPSAYPAEQQSDKTLELVDFLFRPHWHKPDPRYENLTEEAVRRAYRYFQKPIYLVDDQTAIKVVDSKVEVVSEGEWVLIDHD
jgi:dipeptidase E